MLKFEAIDSDGNKFIDEKEAKKHLRAMSYFHTTATIRQNSIKFREEWNQMDVNRDGKISPKEFDNSLQSSVPDTKMLKLMVDIEALDKRIGDFESIN